jgi:hypothetical protein
MAREADTNPRTIPDAKIAARMIFSGFSKSGHYPERPPNTHPSVMGPVV